MDNAGASETPFTFVIRTGDIFCAGDENNNDMQTWLEVSHVSSNSATDSSMLPVTKSSVSSIACRM